MVRWEPGARERLQAAALERFGAQGFDGTTVAEIAATAGLTERTFFRHFADKREVLFAGQDEFERLFLAGIEEAPSGCRPDGDRRGRARGRDRVLPRRAPHAGPARASASSTPTRACRSASSSSSPASPRR